jgi:hypothetical protein
MYAPRPDRGFSPYALAAYARSAQSSPALGSVPLEAQYMAMGAGTGMDSELGLGLMGVGSGDFAPGSAPMPADEYRSQWQPDYALQPDHYGTFSNGELFTGPAHGPAAAGAPGTLEAFRQGGFPDHVPRAAVQDAFSAGARGNALGFSASAPAWSASYGEPAGLHHQYRTSPAPADPGLFDTSMAFSAPASDSSFTAPMGTTDFYPFNQSGRAI